MKTISQPFLFALAVLGPAAGLSSSAEEALVRGDSSQVPVTGKVLVLDNEHTMQGDIERIGEQYRIRYAAGETWVPAECALRLCASDLEAYQFLRGRSNLRDPDEHLRLARWCHLRHLNEQVLAEVQAAVDLRPEHVESKRLLHQLQQQATAAAHPPVAHPAPPEPEPLPTLNVQLTAEALNQFSTRVQPILMNSCVSCHTVGRGGAFKLTRTYDIGSNAWATQQNLASVLAQINSNQPQTSPFLSKALSLHGEMRQAPFKNRLAPAYRALEDWVRLTLAEGSSELPAETRPTASLPPADPPRPAPGEVPGGQAILPSRLPAEPLPVPATLRGEFAQEPRPEGKPVEPTGGLGRTDPELFNRDNLPAEENQPPANRR